jgi:hypothetical protein
MFSTKQAHFCGPPLKSVRQFGTSDLEDLLIEAQGAGLDFDLMVEGRGGRLRGCWRGKDRDPGPLDVGRIFDTGIANHQQPTTQGEPKRSSSASRQSSAFRFAKRGTLRSRVITASLSVICAMVVKIDPAIDSSPRILPLLSAICSRYWCLAGSAACRKAEGGSHCAIRVSQIPKISKVSANFFLQHVNANARRKCGSLAWLAAAGTFRSLRDPRRLGCVRVAQRPPPRTTCRPPRKRSRIIGPAIIHTDKCPVRDLWRVTLLPRTRRLKSGHRQLRSKINRGLSRARIRRTGTC